MLITSSNFTVIFKNIGIIELNYFNLQHILILKKYPQISNIKNLKLIYLLKINIYKNGVPLTTIKVFGRLFIFFLSDSMMMFPPLN